MFERCFRGTIVAMTSQQRGSQNGVQSSRFQRAAQELMPLPDSLIAEAEAIPLARLTRAQRRAAAEVLDSLAALLRRYVFPCLLTIVEDGEATVAVTLKARGVPKAGVGNGADPQ